MKRTTFLLLTAAAGLSASLTLTGCSSTVSAHEARANATPALATTNATHGQSANDMARVVDHNTRTAWDDFKRLMLLDEPSSLQPYTIP